jgi:hypothetical protein
MRATLLARTRIAYSTHSFAELVRWRVPTPAPGSAHEFKYRLACVVGSVCVERCDNEVGKGDHRHFGAIENSCKFSTPERLMVGFQKDIARWNDENSGS